MVTDDHDYDDYDDNHDNDDINHDDGDEDDDDNFNDDDDDEVDDDDDWRCFISQGLQGGWSSLGRLCCPHFSN